MKLDVQAAREILRQASFGALATHSAKLSGFPFVSHVPVIADGCARPVMLLSHLAEHSRNLLADRRVSLMLAAEEGDPQARPRLTLIGEAAPIDAPAALLDRYLRFHPEASTFLGFGDFRFYRIEPLRLRVVAGFARAGWIEAKQWLLPALSDEQEQALHDRLSACLPSGWRVLGVDREGADLCDERGGRRRLAWPLVAGSTAELLTAAQTALQQAGMMVSG